MHVWWLETPGVHGTHPFLCFHAVAAAACDKMKVGFAQKSKQKKKKNKQKKKGAGDGDDTMADVQQPGSPVDAELAPADEQLSAKDKQRKRMELKKALRVKVSSLKQDRCVLLSNALLAVSVWMLCPCVRCIWIGNG
jgi:hypothetical protein